jgi:hypothetical protein
MKTKFLLYGILLVLYIPFFSQHNLLYADDGYELWMKYRKIEDTNRLAEYQQSIKSVTIKGQTQTSLKNISSGFIMSPGIIKQNREELSGTNFAIDTIWAPIMLNR